MPNKNDFSIKEVVGIACGLAMALMAWGFAHLLGEINETNRKIGEVLIMAQQNDQSMLERVNENMLTNAVQDNRLDNLENRK